jgi:hypothetical protein
VGGIKLRRQREIENFGWQLEVVSSPSIIIKKQGIPLRSIPCFLVPVVGL